MAELVEAGIPLSDAVERLRPFPATFAPILRWGEQTPALAEAFRGTAEMCEGRFRFQGVLADTIVLPVMAIVVLFIGGISIVAFILPLIGLIQKLS